MSPADYWKILPLTERQRILSKYYLEKHAQNSCHLGPPRETAD